MMFNVVLADEMGDRRRILVRLCLSTTIYRCLNKVLDVIRKGGIDKILALLFFRFD
jgi:hypothetical protein